MTIDQQPPIDTPRPNVSPHSVHDGDPLRRVTFHHLVQRRDVLSISLRNIKNVNVVGWKSLRWITSCKVTWCARCRSVESRDATVVGWEIIRCIIHHLTSCKVAWSFIKLSSFIKTITFNSVSYKNIITAILEQFPTVLTWPKMSWRPTAFVTMRRPTW